MSANHPAIPESSAAMPLSERPVSVSAAEYEAAERKTLVCLDMVDLFDLAAAYRKLLARSIPDAEPAALTDNASISAALRALSTEMIRIGTAMDYYGGFGPMGAHSLEMLSAAGIAGKWADGIDALPTAACEQGCNGCENCTDYDELQEAGKRDTSGGARE